jgi:hypothetical protein
MYLSDVLEEEGDLVKQLALADEIERRSSGWTGHDFFDQKLYAAYVRWHAGRLDEAHFRSVRDDLARREGWFDSHSFNAWWVFYAERATTPAEGIEALALLPDAGAPSNLNTLFQARTLGHVYLLAGRSQEALPYLRAGATSCRILPFSQTPRAYPALWIREQVELGQALEQTGDTTGACDAYRVVLDRWKNAKPRSVSLEKAKERSKALACNK